VLASVLASSPESGSAAMELLKLLSINAASESIDVGTPYFVPTAALMDVLLAARERGVRIRLVMPGWRIDKPIVRAASRTQWQRLLDAGVELYEFEPTMFHWKVMVVDGLWTSVGSANFDPRSLRLNDEANLNVYDREFARRRDRAVRRERDRGDRARRRPA
jgi:cardiolipin synthase